VKALVQDYLKLEKNVLLMIKAEFFIQLIGAAFFLILNIYLAKNSFSDSEIANFISYRFLAVIVLAFPLGIFIKGRSLKPFFMIGSVGIPIVAIILVLSIEMSYDNIIPFLFILWGIVFTLFSVSSLPFIMRNSKISNQSHAISLNYATHSFGTIISSLFIYFSSELIEGINEGQILTIISVIGFIGIYFILKLKNESIIYPKKDFNILNYDWKLIFKATIPTFIIAVGAGLTIPFINLFFFHSFDVDSQVFALIGGFASLLVAICSLQVPNIKNRLGFKKGILSTQLLSVIALIALATTEFFSSYYWALPIAILCYWIRTPLMNMAAPMTSELTMNYVGKNNQEILSAVMAAIWSGSWFFSSQIVSILKAKNMTYAFIFYITAALYLLGILMYYLLILDYNKNKSKIEYTKK